MNTPFVFFFAVNTLKDTSGFFNMVLLIYGVWLPPLCQKPQKKQDFSKAEFFSYEEGLCVQCMHIGAYDDELVTVDAMHRFMEEQGYALDITDRRMHHEIYLSDARKVAPEKLKTVIRHPIKRA